MDPSSENLSSAEMHEEPDATILGDKIHSFFKNHPDSKDPKRADMIAEDGTFIEVVKDSEGGGSTAYDFRILERIEDYVDNRVSISGYIDVKPGQRSELTDVRLSIDLHGEEATPELAPPAVLARYRELNRLLVPYRPSQAMQEEESKDPFARLLNRTLPPKPTGEFVNEVSAIFDRKPPVAAPAAA